MASRRRPRPDSDGPESGERPTIGSIPRPNPGDANPVGGAMCGPDPRSSIRQAGTRSPRTGDDPGVLVRLPIVPAAENPGIDRSRFAWNRRRRSRPAGQRPDQPLGLGSVRVASARIALRPLAQASLQFSRIVSGILRLRAMPLVAPGMAGRDPGSILRTGRGRLVVGQARETTTPVVLRHHCMMFPRSLPGIPVLDVTESTAGPDEAGNPV
jgi:hypothetical protein